MVKLLWDLMEKSVNFSTLATFNIRLLLFYGAISPTGEKKIVVTQENSGK